MVERGVIKGPDYRPIMWDQIQTVEDCKVVFAALFAAYISKEAVDMDKMCVDVEQHPAILGYTGQPITHGE